MDIDGGARDDGPMFELPKIFHISHTVDDIDAAVAWYDDVFSPRVWQRTELFGTQLALLVIGDAVLMPMFPSPDFPTSPGRFKERFGARLHSMAIYVQDPADLVNHLRSRGLRLTGSSGQDLDNLQDEIWTQPRETPVVCEFFEPRASMDDPRLNEPDWSSSYWRNEHPLGIQDTILTVVTGSLAGAVPFFVDGLRGKVIHEASTPHGTRSAFVSLSDEVTVEVAQPEDPASRAATDLAAGGAFHAVTFRVADLERATAHVESKGIRIERPAPGHVVLDPADAHGVLFRLTDRQITAW
jgi:catechol 2,3-dioxygenase-like lactoylglutathione lyase family enzyme